MFPMWIYYEFKYYVVLNNSYLLYEGCFFDHEINFDKQSQAQHDKEVNSHESLVIEQPSQQDIEAAIKVLAMLYGKDLNSNAVASKSNVVEMSKIIMAVIGVVVWFIN